MNQMKSLENRKISFKNLLSGVPEYACVVVLVIVLIVAGIVSPVFFTDTNIQNVLKQGAVLAVLSIGMGYVLISGCIDLSVGINMAICALISVVMQQYVGDVGAILLALLAGIAISSFNMLIIYLTKARAIEILSLIHI